MDRTRRHVVAALLATAAVAPRAWAQAGAPEPAVAVRLVIQAQLDAFAADDADRAWLYASPGIQQQFGSADAFMALVREHYPAVVRPRRVSFEPLQGDGDERVQPVRVVDEEGAAWMALYLMQRQRDRTWRIGGCRLVRDGQTTTT